VWSEGPSLALSASARLERLGYANVHVHCGDGTLGLPEFPSFDAILVAAAAPAIPQPLLAQLAEGGRMIVPVGDTEHQELQLIEKCGEIISQYSTRGVPICSARRYHGWQDPPSR